MVFVLNGINMEVDCMRDNYDFSNAVKNPFSGKIKGKYTVTIHYDFTENTKKQNNVKKNNAHVDEVWDVS